MKWSQEVNNHDKFHIHLLKRNNTYQFLAELSWQTGQICLILCQFRQIRQVFPDLSNSVKI